MATPGLDLGESALRLFGRSVELAITSQPTSGGYFDGGGSETLTITNMRVQFEIKKALGKQPNPAVVTITNLSKSTRGSLERLPLYCTLRAGHDGVLLPLFAGNVTYGRSELKSADWETKIQVADGARAFSQARANKSYKAPISVRQIVSDLARTMGLSMPQELQAATDLQQSLSGDFSAFGPTRDLLTKVLAPYGYSWSIQDGRLQVLKGGAPNAREPWNIDVEDGMIGSPEGSVPHKPGAVAEISVDVLLFPQIVPGDTVKLTSKSYAGVSLRVNDVNHKGDTEGKEWKTSLKLVPLGSPPPAGRGKK